MAPKPGSKSKTLAEGRKPGSGGHNKKTREQRQLEGRKIVPPINTQKLASVESLQGLTDYTEAAIKDSLISWLMDNGCLEAVDSLTIAKFAAFTETWYIAQQQLQKNGYTTINHNGNEVISPYWKVSCEAVKISNELWHSIKAIVAANGVKKPKEKTLLEQLME